MVFSLNFLVTFSFKRKSDNHSSREKVTITLQKEKITSTMKSKTKAFMRSLDPSSQFIFFKAERSELSHKLG
jgi:hypothetical protein